MGTTGGRGSLGGWGRDAYFTGSPYLPPGTARALVEANVALVGIDALNIDDIEGRGRSAHRHPPPA